MKLNELVEHAVGAMGFDRLNCMQEKMLEEATSGRNIMLLSPTGSGKTIAFLLPLIAFIEDGGTALIIVPSRELALQIQEVAKKLKTGVRTVCWIGGKASSPSLPQDKAKGETTLVIATPGRLKDNIEREMMDCKEVRAVVLDEYDKSLELGFEEEMKYIVTRMEKREQMILTSATHAMPIAPWLNFKNYVQLDFLPKTETKEKEDGAKYQLSEKLDVYQVKSPIADKLETLKEIICSIEDNGQIIVFSNYRESSERISHYLTEQGIENALYHGGLEQEHREKALARFRSYSLRILVSTDLASRGLDIPDVSHIIHYHLPADEEAFVHRNGRTARAGASGAAYLIIGPSEFVPSYLKKEPMFFSLHNSSKPFPAPPYSLIYIGRGKKDKISKGDVVGFFTKNAGIKGADLGRIDVYERCAYCAVKRELAEDVVKKVSGLKIKGEKTHYLLVK